MALEMAFECLLVSDDPAVLSTMDPILHDFSISTSICPQSLRTGNWLERSATDLVVVDLEAVNSTDLWRQLQQFRTKQKPTVVAVSATDRVLPGVHIVLRKPVTHESGVRSLKVAYSKMLQDFRKHTRFALMESVLATRDSNDTFPVVVTNIGAGGVGIKTNEIIQVGSVLSFRVKLPELETEVSIRARILWAQPSGIAGCEFLQMSPFDAQVLHVWLESRYRIKKPVKAVG
jgi:PilZ domain